MQVYLKKHGPGFAGHSLKVEFSRQDREVNLTFQVQKRSSQTWDTDAVFTQDWNKNWGLWNKDVVEAFLQLRSHESELNAPYLEIQVSPLNQPFALIVTEPRKTYFPPKQLEFFSEVSLEGRFWHTKMKIILPAELKGTKLFGGFFSCLSHNPREFYALELNPEDQPDFHRPELFLALDEA
jgi:hypothetical protein